MLVFKARPRKAPNLSQTRTPSEERIMRMMGKAMDKVRAGVVRDENRILDALLHDPVERVVNLVSADPWLDVQADLEAELLGELLDAGRRVKLPSIQKATISWRFDDDRPEARAWAAKEAGTLIREITEDQRATVRDYVERASGGDGTVTQVARGLRDVVGLTSQQAGWVENFRNREILAQMNTGKTYDQAYAASEAATERYQKRIHRYRTETIARTEIIRASSEGRQEAWRQGIEEGFISRFAQKQWLAEFDACQICLDLEALGPIPITSDFPEGEPPAHPNCRCDVLLVDDPEAEWEGITDEQLDEIIDNLVEPFAQPEEQRSEIEIPETPQPRHTADHWTDDDNRLALELVGEWKPTYSAREFDPETGYGPYRVPEDMMMKGIVQQQGFDARPTVVDTEEFNRLRDGGLQYVGRGITGNSDDEVQDYMRTFREGDLFVPRGIFGSGTYGSPNQDVLDHFSTRSANGEERPAGSIMNMLIKPDARVIDYDEARGIERRLTDDRNRTLDEGDPKYLFLDTGRAAAAEGYDVIRIPNPVIGGERLEGVDYYLILNRGALIVEGES